MILSAPIGSWLLAVRLSSYLIASVDAAQIASRS